MNLFDALELKKFAVVSQQLEIMLLPGTMSIDSIRAQYKEQPSKTKSKKLLRIKTSAYKAQKKKKIIGRCS